MSETGSKGTHRGITLENAHKATKSSETALWSHRARSRGSNACSPVGALILEGFNGLDGTHQTEQ